MHRILALAAPALLGLLLLPGLRGDEPAKTQPVYLKVWVPPTAQLEIEGAQTKAAGELRLFESPPVAVGKVYSYTLKATWVEGGKPREVQRTVRVAAGKETVVDLRADDKKADDKQPDVIYVPTPHKVVERMLELAKVTKDDVVYDLGCGDGRIPVAAAKKYGCKAWGFDVDPRRIQESNENVKKGKVENLVTIEKKDIFTLDLSKATVVTLYLLPDLNVKLIPQLEKLKPGCRIVSHDFDMRGVKPDKVERIKAGDDLGGGEREHTIYLWTTPLKKEKE